jgi:hypothetical protein
MRVTFRPSVAADIAAIIDQPLPHRIRAITAVADGKVLGVGGLGFRPDGTVIAFVAMIEEARRYRCAIHRAGLLAMDMIRDSGVPQVIAEAQPNNPAAEPWLLRLGFRPREFAGLKAFVWERAFDVDASPAI